MSKIRGVNHFYRRRNPREKMAWREVGWNGVAWRGVGWKNGRKVDGGRAARCLTDFRLPKC